MVDYHSYVIALKYFHLCVVLLWLVITASNNILIAQDQSQSIYRSPSPDNNERYDTPWRWVHFTTESGLPSNDVTRIYESSDTTIWAETKYGIAWFDGYEWNPVYFSGIQRNALPGKIIGEVRDSILIWTPYGGRFIGKKGEFRMIGLDYQEDLFLADSLILTLKNDTLWKTITTGQYQVILEQYLPIQQKAYVAYPAGFGTLLLDTEEGLLKLNSQSVTRLFQTDQRFKLGTFQASVKGKGIFYIQQPYSLMGLWEWNEYGKVIREKQEGNDEVIAVGIDSSDHKVIVYRNGTVRLQEGASWVTLPHSKSALKTTRHVLYDRSRDLWFATDDGIYVYRRSLSPWSYWKHASITYKNTCNSLLRDHNGNFWIATGAGIDIRDTTGKLLREINSINQQQLYSVTGLAEDSSKNIWVSSGSAFQGAYRWNGTRWDYFNPSYQGERAWFHKIYVDAVGRVWLLGIGKYTPRHAKTQPGVFCFENGKFTHWGEEDGLLNGRVYSLEMSNDSSLWFGTYMGISKYYHGLWKHWDLATLAIDRVFVLSIDHEGRVWYGNNGHIDASGVGYIDTNNSIQHFTTDDGLLNNNIWDIKIDDLDNIWLTTPSGINVYQNNDWLSYDIHSGLTSAGNWPLLFNGNTVYVGTVGEGVARLDRSKILPSPTRLIINNPIMNERDVMIEWKTFSYQGILEPSSIQTRYRLMYFPNILSMSSSYSSQWSPWNTDHNRTFANMSSGSYILQIQALGLHGQFDISENVVHFTVLLPLYLRPIIFYPALSLLASIMFLIGVLLWRKRAHDIALRESEVKFRAVATTTSSAIFVFDEDKFLFLNPSAEKLTGYSLDELKAKTFWDIIHPEFNESIKQFFSVWLNQTSVTRRFECKILDSGKSERWIDVTAARIRFGKTLSIIASAFDITESKIAEEALRVSEERYRIITELVSDYAYLDRIEEDGTITVLWVTESAQRLTGYSNDDWKDPALMLRYIHPDDLQESIAYFTRVIKGETASHEGRIITKDGRVLWMHNEARPIWNADHTRVTYMYGAAHEITERKHREEELHKLSSELALTEQRERQRLAQFLHDVIGQALAIVKMKLEMLEEKHDADVFKKEMDDIFILIQETIANTRTATFELCPPVLYEFGLVAGIEWLLQKLREQHSIAIEFKSRISQCVLKEEVRNIVFNCVREVLLNILKHAKASTIVIELAQKERTLSILLNDDGIGFDSETITMASQQTIGFGLFNLRQQISYVGGSLDISSEPGKGTTVHISAPIHE